MQTVLHQQPIFVIIITALVLTGVKRLDTFGVIARLDRAVQ